MLVSIGLASCVAAGSMHASWMEILNTCSGGWYQERGTVCVRPNIRYIYGEVPGSVPASAIATALTKSTTIDADAPYYDKVVQALRQGLQEKGGATVWVNRGNPNAYAVAFMNHPATSSFDVYTTSTNEAATGSDKFTIEY